MARRGRCAWKEYDRLQSEVHTIRRAFNDVVRELDATKQELAKYKSMHESDISTIRNMASTQLLSSDSE